MTERRRVLGGVVVLLSAALVVSGCEPSPPRKTVADAAGAPRLVADRGTIDLGNVPVGTWASATFNVRNAGDAPLRFIDAPWVKAVAGC